MLVKAYLFFFLTLACQNVSAQEAKSTDWTYINSRRLISECIVHLSEYPDFYFYLNRDYKSTQKFSILKMSETGNCVQLITVSFDKKTSGRMYYTSDPDSTSKIYIQKTIFPGQFASGEIVPFDSNTVIKRNDSLIVTFANLGNGIIATEIPENDGFFFIVKTECIDLKNYVYLPWMSFTLSKYPSNIFEFKQELDMVLDNNPNSSQIEANAESLRKLFGKKDAKTIKKYLKKHNHAKEWQ